MVVIQTQLRWRWVVRSKSKLAQICWESIPQIIIFFDHFFITKSVWIRGKVYCLAYPLNSGGLRSIWICFESHGSSNCLSVRVALISGWLIIHQLQRCNRVAFSAKKLFCEKNDLSFWVYIFLFSDTLPTPLKLKKYYFKGILTIEYFRAITESFQTTLLFERLSFPAIVSNDYFHLTHDVEVKLFFNFFA